MTTHEETFRRWLREHAAGLGRAAASYARTRAEQQDLLQDIALALWQALPTFRGACSERTFVLRIAHNRGMNFAARERLRRPHPDGADGPAAVSDERPDAEAELHASHRRERLFAAVRALPMGQRQVLALALEGVSHDEIGDVLGLQPNAVAVRLSRARDALRAMLGGSAP